MIIQRYIVGLLLALMSGSIWASVAEKSVFNYDDANKQIIRMLVLDLVVAVEREELVCSQDQIVKHAAYYFATPNPKSAPVVNNPSFDVVLNLTVDVILLKQRMSSDSFNSALLGPPAAPPPKNII